ncbi:MAG TPA: hypothetical protein VM694_27440 [Polyangium sp.]|nr:hypothetical protein [Polyangium sp.]
MDLPPHEIDRLIARATDELRQKERAFRVEGTAARGNVLEAFRAVSTRSMWIELGERGAKDPILAAAHTHVAALTITRVTWAERVRLAEAWHAPTIEIEAPAPERVSPRVTLERLLDETVPARRHVLADALTRGAGDLADVALVREERRAEAFRRLGIEDVDALEIPVKPAASLARIAERLLDVTTELMPKRAPRWDDALAVMLARDAGEGWPARLSPRWFQELFGKTGLFDGLSIPPFMLPRLIGATSFVRALARFGEAFAEADVPRAAPFVLARPPFDLRRARSAALFGALPSDPTFGVRSLGLGRSRARAQAQDVARAVLLSLRLDAARVLLRGTVTMPHRARRERFEEITDRALGVSIPGVLAFVLPASDPQAPTRLAGALLALSDRRALLERFDEDWFQNPRAALALREEHTVLPRDPTCPEAAIEAGLGELSRLLAELFR